LYDDPDAEEGGVEELTEATTARDPLAELHRDESSRLKGAETPGQARGGCPVGRVSAVHGAQPDCHDRGEREDDRHVAGEMQVRVARMREYEGPPSGIRDRDEVRKEMADDQTHERKGERGELAKTASVAHRRSRILRAPSDEAMSLTRRS
jgi:hypothetical protein